MSQRNPQGAFRFLKKDINKFFLHGDRVLVLTEKERYKHGYAVYVQKVDNPNLKTFVYTKYLREKLR